MNSRVKRSNKYLEYYKSTNNVELKCIINNTIKLKVTWVNVIC